MRNIIFDLDGTLLDTLDDLAASTNHALAECNLPLRTREEVRRFVGNGVGKLIERAVQENTDEAVIKRCLAAFRAHYAEHCLDRTVPYPDIMETLTLLREHEVAMAIVSNKLQAAVSELNARFFADHISIAVGETPQIARKPAPDMLLAAMDQLDATTSDTIYVGDADTDILCAHNAGIRCISVTWGFRSREFLTAHGAQTLINNPKELLQFT